MMVTRAGFDASEARMVLGGAQGVGWRRRRRGFVAVAVATAIALPLGGCGDDDGEAAGDVAESAGARVVAEAIRVSLLVRDLDDGQRADDVDVLREAVSDLAGEPDVSGIDDSDGDGRDDDGKVEVRVNDEAACLSVADNGEVDVTGGRC
jgi:hypothetical protein